MTSSPRSTPRRALSGVACAALICAGALLSPGSTAAAATSAAGAQARTDAGGAAGAARTQRKTTAAALRVARNQKGDRYRYGATGPDRFDCSGLVMFAFERVGQSVPRTSGEQARASRRIPRSRARAGDLAFFYDRGGVYHVGFYVGDDRVLHAPGTGKVVQVADIWTSKVFFARIH
jgi:cell wall-associated NlpC family hydrolase